jgi:MATE family multidrug resistance protein
MDHERPRLGTLLHLAWPIVVARSAQVVVGFTDALMVAKLGEEALAAVTTGGFNAFFLFLLPMGTVFIVSSFSSQLSGKGELRAARRYPWYGLAVAVVAGLFAAGSIPFIDDALALVDYDDRVREAMASYMSIRLFAGFAVVGLEAIGNYYQGLGNTRLPMVAQLTAMVLNVGLNWVLIFGNLGAPALGTDGAAWASLIATTTAFFFLFACFLLKVGAPKPDDADESGGPLRLAELARMVRFGLPAGFNWFFEFAAFNFFINVVVVGLGTTGLAAMNTVIQISSMAFMPSFGIASAGAIIVGKAIGAGRPDDVGVSVRLTLIAATGWQMCAAVLYIFFPDALMRLFAEDPEAGAELIEMGASMLRLSVLWQLSDAVASTMAETLRAAGDTTWPLYARLVIAWLIFVPASLVAVRVLEGGAVGAILSLVVYLGLLALALSWRYRSGRWRDIGLTS